MTVTSTELPHSHYSYYYYYYHNNSHHSDYYYYHNTSHHSDSDYYYYDYQNQLQWQNSKCIFDHIKDNFCDDNNNNAKCGWDGGACCAQTARNGYVRKSYCKKVW